MRVARSARRYAKALFRLAREEQRLASVASDLADLRRLDETSADFSRLIRSPVIPEDRRTVLLRELLDGRADPLTLRFALFLVERGRIDQLADIALLFEELFNEHAGILRARVESAAPLTADQEAAIRKRLGSRFGKRVVTDTEVRPELLGGFRIRIGDTLHDYSLQSQLAHLRKQWINA
jgi:F-type H+-transporting ATPase subunit delta